jgi:hypothetical protein
MVSNVTIEIVCNVLELNCNIFLIDVNAIGIRSRIIAINNIYLNGRKLAGRALRTNYAFVVGENFRDSF